MSALTQRRTSRFLRRKSTNASTSQLSTSQGSAAAQVVGGSSAKEEKDRDLARGGLLARDGRGDGGSASSFLATTSECNQAPLRAVRDDPSSGLVTKTLPLQSNAARSTGICSPGAK